MDRWHPHAVAGDYFDLEHALGSVVMSALLRSMFRYNADTALVDQWVQACTDYGYYIISRTATAPLPSWVPNPYRGKGERAQTMFLTQLDDMIATRVAEQSDLDAPGDVLDVLLSMDFEGTPEMQYRRMRSELSGLVFAGFDTTAEALAWTFALLARTPGALERAYAEVDALGSGPLSYDNVEQLPYLRACFDEAQRLQSVPINMRTATVEDEIGGYHIPAGSHMVISPLGLQTDPRFWKNPLAYNPDRWFTDEIEKNAFVPFSTGPRKCMGMRKAYIDGVLILAAVMRRYTFVVRDGWTPKHALHVSIGLKGGLPVRLHTRYPGLSRGCVGFERMRSM